MPYLICKLDSSDSFSKFGPEWVAVEVTRVLIIGALFDLFSGFNRDVMAIEDISTADDDIVTFGGSTSIMLNNYISHLINFIFQYVITSQVVVIKVVFYIAQYPVRRTAQSALHCLPSLADLLIPTPTRLLREAF